MFLLEIEKSLRQNGLSLAFQLFPFAFKTNLVRDQSVFCSRVYYLSHSLSAILEISIHSFFES